MNDLFMRNNKEFRITDDLVQFFQKLKSCYDTSEAIPFYNPRSMTYELMSKDEYNMLLGYLYNSIRRQNNGKEV